MNYFSLSLCILLLAGFTQCEPAAPEERSLQEVAAGLNKKCPQMIDSETRLEGLEIRDNDNTVVYKYTLINLLAENVDTVEFRRALWPGILSLIKVNPSLKSLRDQKTRFEYYYQDKNKHFIYTFKILPADYNS